MNIDALDDFLARWTWRFVVGWCAGGLAVVCWIAWKLTR